MEVGVALAVEGGSTLAMHRTWSVRFAEPQAPDMRRRVGGSELRHVSGFGDGFHWGELVFEVVDDFFGPLSSVLLPCFGGGFPD